MAGNNASFSAVAFRDAIKFAMNMGTPQEVVQRVLFRWSPRRTFSSQDSEHNPFVWTAVPSSEVVNSGVEVDCAVEFVDSREMTSSVGLFHLTRVMVTLLDVDYVKIIDGEGFRADLLTINGNEYEVKFEPPPVGLFDVTVHQIYAVARDES